MELIASILAIFGVRQLIFCGKSIISQDFFCWLSLQQCLWDLFYEFLKRNESVAKYRVINCLVKCISIGFHFNLVIKILDISALDFYLAIANHKYEQILVFHLLNIIILKNKKIFGLVIWNSSAWPFGISLQYLLNSKLDCKWISALSSIQGTVELHASIDMDKW